MVLDGDQRAELDHALSVARASGKPLGELTANDFPLPGLAAEVRRWREVLAAGRGFLLVSGLQVQDWSAEDAERVFWCLGQHLGLPGSQNPAGELLGHVTDTGDDRDDPQVRLYRTASEIAFHCDAADVVGLLCLANAPHGGASRLASSVTVFNELRARRPDLAARLFAPVKLDLRNEQRADMPGFIDVTPVRFGGGMLRTFYHSDYFRSVERHEGVSLTDAERALFDLYEEIAATPGVYVDMALRPGDLQLVSNHTVVHARTGYSDGSAPAERRHLLRLWLTLE